MSVTELNPYNKTVPSSKYSANNPYVGLTYKKTGWQNFLSALGIRTQADAWQENMQVQANEWESAMQMKLRDEQYELPINQVSRMKAAGINPDLQGGNGIDSGSAVAMPEDPSTPMQTSGDEGMIWNFASNIMSLFSTALGMTEGIQGVVRNRLDNTFQAMTNESFLSDFAGKMFPYFLPQTPSDEISDDGSALSWQGQAYEMAKLFAGKMPKKMQQSFLNKVQGFWNSAPGTAEAYKNWRERVQNRKGYSVESHTNYSEEDDVLAVISDELGKLNEKVIKSSMSREVSENENAETYANSLDSSLQASAENATNLVTKQNMDMTGILRSSVESMIKRLDGMSQEKGVKGGIASAMMALLSVLQLYITTQGMPSFNRSSSMDSKGNTKVQTSLSF